MKKKNIRLGRVVNQANVGGSLRVLHHPGKHFEETTGGGTSWER